jgi:glycosyltransferase involved in cell wall biosynthesis
MMRVLHVVTSFEPEAGSIAVSLRGLFDKLREYEVESAGLAVEPVAHGFRGLVDFGHGPGAVEPLTEGADVVHIHGWDYELAHMAAKAARSLEKPFFLSPMGDMTESRFHPMGWTDRFRRLVSEKGMIRRAAAVLAINELEEKSLKEQGLNDNIRRLPYGLDMPLYRMGPPTGQLLPDLPEGRLLLLMAPLHPIEGHVPLLKAFAEIGLDASGWNLALAGPEFEYWQKTLEAGVRRKGGEERVLFARAPDVTTQRAWLGHASLLAAPSLHIRCPISAMQAIAAYVPVLATTFGTPAGLEKAIRVCPPQREPLRETLRALLTSPDEELEEMARNARHVGERTFDWSILAEEYVGLYQKHA